MSTPIGNLGDISRRAMDVLSSVPYLLCEDTRKTGLMIKNLNLKKTGKLISFYDANEAEKIPYVLNLLISGSDVGLVSNAGTPLMSDPGFKLVRLAIDAGVNVIAIPGPTSITTAIAVSGLPCDKFLFLGFLPKKTGKRQKLFEDLKRMPMPLTYVSFESPYRIKSTLLDIQSVFGNIEIAICRELTKLHETITRGTVSEVMEKIDKENNKGEITLLFRP